MKGKGKISIDEFDEKKFSQEFASEALADHTKAIVTHFLQNIGTPQESLLKKEAQGAIKMLVKYKQQAKNETIVAENALQGLLFEATNVPFPGPKVEKFKFIDLFAGIGGFRLAMQNLGGKCVFTSEWDKDAQKTYKANYGEVPFGDITKEETKKYIPKDFDILCAGFPCQAFSIAGYRKGFADTRGTLFFDIEQIAEKHKPSVIFLENVKNLISHDEGKTFKTILSVLEDKLGYNVFYQVLNTATHANIPQNRERIFIVAFNPSKVKNWSKFEFPKPIKLTHTIHDFLLKDKQADNFYYKEDHQYYPELSKAMVSMNTVYQWRRVYARENKSNLCPTLTANMGAGGHNVPLIRDKFGIRKLTPSECFALQSYPIHKYLLPPIANSRLYMQAGNSVTTILIEKIASQIIKVL